MTPSNTSGHEEVKEADLLRRDWFLPLLLTLFTIAVVLGSKELIVRRLFPQGGETIYALVHDSSAEIRGYTKEACRGGDNHEIPGKEHCLNSCGHRTFLGCGPRSTGVYRTVLADASVELGEDVPMEKTVAVWLPKDISQYTGRKAELLEASGRGRRM
jgi:hypothetical protein